jgi:hypothetical protein
MNLPPRRLKIASVSVPTTSGKPVVDRQAAMWSSGLARVRWLLPMTPTSRSRGRNGVNQSKSTKPPGNRTHLTFRTASQAASISPG